jgi:UTP--glucose-1-phosphate uridylyltransferase
MVARFNETGRSQVLAKRMDGDLSEYSVIQTKDPLNVEGQIGRIVEFIEKPDEPQTLDSDLMAVGRYVLSADVGRAGAHSTWRMGPYSADRCDR